MLTDLTRACPECRCRVTGTACPLCAGGALVSARFGRESLVESADHAPRATRVMKWLIAVPAVVGVAVGTIGCAEMFRASNSSSALVSPAAMAVAPACAGLWIVLVHGAYQLVTHRCEPEYPVLDVALAPRPRASELWWRLRFRWAGAGPRVKLIPWLVALSVFVALRVATGDSVRSLLIMVVACVGTALMAPAIWIMMAACAATIRYLARPPSLFRGTLRRAPDEARLLALWTGTRRPIEGVVTELADPPLRSPLSGKPCAAVRLRGFAGESRVEDAVVGEFCIDADDGGRYRVQPGPAAVLVAADEVVADPSGELELFLRDRGLPAAQLRLREGRIDVGRRVRVWGRPGASEADGGSGYRSGAGRRPLTADDDERLVIEAR